MVQRLTDFECYSIVREGRGSFSAIPLTLAVILSGCGTTSLTVAPESQTQINTTAADRWIILPFMNYSEAPEAGEKVESIVGGLLETRGMVTSPHPTDAEGGLTLSDRHRYQSALDAAKKAGYTYGLSGTVTEWKYKSGVEGEPAVGITLQVVTVPNGRTVWSVVGSRSGWGRDTVSGIAQGLVEDELQHLSINTHP